MYPPTQNMPPPNPDWNGYQVDGGGGRSVVVVAGGCGGGRG
ncbi:hypothetical protein HanHA300_Chr14g0518441 [Helianthus annuus]|nr:hypothetical protein HanHA300_Chr14g0518441 [Helianthus annuus]